MDEKGGHSNFQFFGELPFPQYAAGVGGTLNCCAFLYHSGILSTIFILDLNDAILFLQCLLCVCVSVYIFIIFARILFMYVMYLTSLTGSIDDRTVSITF